jgi:hypothetical protein
LLHRKSKEWKQYANDYTFKVYLSSIRMVWFSCLLLTIIAYVIINLWLEKWTDMFDV